LDDFVQDDFKNTDSCEVSFDDEMEPAEEFAGESEFENEPDRTKSEDDDFTAKDAFILGSAIGFAYEQGLRERKRRKRKRFSDDSD
jgi:hypothetical protein